MGFSNKTFPTLTYGNNFNGLKSTFNMPVSVVGNGTYEYRTLRSAYGRLQVEIPARSFSPQDQRTLLSFYNSVGGQFESFLYRNNEFDTLDNWVLGAGTQLPAPSAPVASATGTTGLSSGSFAYAITALDMNGETAASIVTHISIASSASIALTWPIVPGASAYNVYGRTAGTLQLIATVSTNNYVDVGIALQPIYAPTVNLSGALVFPVLINIQGLAHPLFHLDGCTVSPAGYTFSVVNGVPSIVYPAGSAPTFGTNVTISGAYYLAMRFDMPTFSYTMSNGATPLDAAGSAAQLAAVKMTEVFE